MANTALVFFVISLAWQACLAIPSGPSPTTPCAETTTAAPGCNETCKVNITVVVHVNPNAKPNIPPVVKSDNQGGLTNIVVVIVSREDVKTEDDIDAIVDIDKIVRDVCGKNSTIKIRISVIIKVKGSNVLEVTTIVKGKTVSVVTQNLSVDVSVKLEIKSVVCVNGTAVISIGDAGCNDIIIVVVVCLNCKDKTIEDVAKAYSKSVVILITLKNNIVKVEIAAKGVVIIVIIITIQITDCKDDGKIIKIEIIIKALVDGKPCVDVNGNEISIIIVVSSDQTSNCNDDDITIVINININDDGCGKTIVNVKDNVVTVSIDIGINITVKGDVCLNITIKIKVNIQVTVGGIVIVINNGSDDCKDDTQIVINIEIGVNVTVTINGTVVTVIGDIDIKVCVKGNVVVVVIAKSCSKKIAESEINVKVSGIIVTIIVKPSSGCDSDDLQVSIEIKARINVEICVIVNGTSVSIIGVVDIKIIKLGRDIVLSIDDAGVKIFIDGEIKVVTGDETCDCDDDSVERDCEILVQIKLGGKPIIFKIKLTICIRIDIGC